MSRVFRADIGLNWHSHMLKLLDKLGYPYDSKGVCYGLAVTASTAHLSGKMDIFEESLAILSHAEANDLKSLYAGLSQKEFIDLLALLDSVALHQEISKFKHLFPNAMEFHDQSAGVVETSKLFKLKHATDESMTQVNTCCRLCTKDELHLSLINLHERCLELKNAPVSFIVSKLSHAISINFDPETKNWIMIDANQPGGSEGPVQHTLTPLEVADFIWDSLATPVGGDTQCLIDILTLCKENNLAEVQTCIVPWIEQGDKGMLSAERLKRLSDAEKTALLTQATRVGDMKMIQALAKFGPKVIDSVFDHYISPLTMAVKLGHTKAVKVLLDAGSNPNSQLHTSHSLLQHAINADHIEIVRMLLQHPHTNKDFNQIITHPPLLNFVAKHGDLVAMHELLKNKTVDINFQPHSGDSPLHCAAEAGHLEAVELLLKDPRIDPNAADYYGNTAYHIASLKAQSENHLAIAEAIKKHPKFIPSKHTQGSPLLHYHIKRDDKEAVQKIIWGGRYPRSERDRENHSALHYALQKDINLSLELVRGGFDINEIDPDDNQHILVVALYSGFDEVFAAALERYSRDKQSFDLNHRNTDGYGFMHYAIENSYYTIAESLIEIGIVMDERDLTETYIAGKTLLHFASMYMNSDALNKIIERMITLKLPLDLRDRHGNTPFFYAIQEKKFEVADRIIEPSPNSTTIYGDLARLLGVIQQYSWTKTEKPLMMALDMLKVMKKFREEYIKEGAGLLNKAPYLSLNPAAPMLETLFKLEAEKINIENMPKSPESLLHQAVACENIPLLDVLLTNEILTNELMLSSHAVNAESKTVLEVALENHSREIVIKLIKAGASLVEIYSDTSRHTIIQLENVSCALRYGNKITDKNLLHVVEDLDKTYALNLKELLAEESPKHEGIHHAKKF